MRRNHRDSSTDRGQCQPMPRKCWLWLCIGVGAACICWRWISIHGSTKDGERLLTSVVIAAMGVGYLAKGIVECISALRGRREVSCDMDTELYLAKLSRTVLVSLLLSGAASILSLILLVSAIVSGEWRVAVGSTGIIVVGLSRLVSAVRSRRMLQTRR